jgi:Putative amidoligase enzyme
LASPLFRAYRGSPWREEVERTWAFLQNEYEITTSTECGTHIHISIRRGFSLADMKKIAQCIMFFEPAIEALLPDERRGNSYMKSNWLDNRKFGLQNKSPRQAIREIGLAQTRQEIVGLMSPDLDSHFAWNFQTLQRLRTIEFRKGTPSKNAREALMWAEFAMSFILSAMQTRDVPTYLGNTQPNVGGLKAFVLQEKTEPYMCDPEYLKPLWVGKTGRESRQPRVGGPFHQAQREMLDKKRQMEKRRYLMRSKVDQEARLNPTES